jgi:hypothetical protein
LFHFCTYLKSSIIDETGKRWGMKQWKYFLGGERIGPISEDQLVKKLLENELPRTITVWTDGMFVWKAIDETPLAEKLVIPAPVPAPPALAASEPPAPSITEMPTLAPVPDFPVAADPFQPAPAAIPSPSPPVVSPFPETAIPEVPMAPAPSTVIPETTPPPFTSLFAAVVPPAVVGLPPQSIMPELAQAVPQTQDPAPVPPLVSTTSAYDPLLPVIPTTPVAQFAATAEPVPSSSETQLLGSTTPYVEVHPPAPKQFKVSSPLRLLVSVAGFGIGYYLIWMLPPKIGIAIAIGSAVGFICGLLPFFLAKQRNNLKLGRIAVGVCWLSGAAFGLLLALPAAIIFTIIVLTGKNRDTGY